MVEPTETSWTPGQPRRGRTRRRWKPRITAILLLLGAALVALHFWGVHRDEGRIRAVVAGIRARGEPLAWRDFKPPPIPLDEDAAACHKEALRLLERAFRLDAGEADGADPNDVRLADLWRLLGDGLAGDPGLRRKHAREVREILALSKGIFPLCRRARTCTGADWGVDYDASAWNCQLPYLGDLWHVSELLCLAAVLAGEDGNSAEAVACLRDALAFARSVESTPSLASFERACRMREKVYRAAEQVAPGLAAGAGDAEAPRAVRELAEELLRPDGFERALLGGRAFCYEVCEAIRSGEVRLSELRLGDEGGLLWKIRNFHAGMIHPASYAADEVWLLERMTQHVEAARAESYPAALDTRRRPRAEPRVGLRGRLAKTYLPSLSRFYEMRFRDVAFCRLAATAVAMRLYELDHGRRPAELAVLAPRYLPAVPADPFSAKGEPLCYRPDPVRPLLYSVFRDGKDGGGGFLIGPAGYVDLADSPDLVFFLKGDRPMPRQDDGDAARRDGQGGSRR